MRHRKRHISKEKNRLTESLSHRSVASICHVREVNDPLLLEPIPCLQQEVTGTEAYQVYDNEAKDSGDEAHLRNCLGQSDQSDSNVHIEQVELARLRIGCSHSLAAFREVPHRELRLTFGVLRSGHVAKGVVVLLGVLHRTVRSYQRFIFIIGQIRYFLTAAIVLFL